MDSESLDGFTYVTKRGELAETVFLLHGTGADEHDLVPLGEFLAPGATIISPRGRAPEGAMNRWFARHSPGVLDVEDIKRRAAELAAFVPRVAAEHSVDAGKIWAVGFSNGANMAAAMLLLYPELFAGAVLLRPMLPLQPGESPDLTGKPVYVAAGTRDTMIPRASTEELLELLQHSGAALTAHWEEAGHGFGGSEVDGVKAWLTTQIPALSQA